MDFTEIMKQKIDYCSRHTDMPMELQQKAKKLCWEYNRTSPEEKEERSRILKELLGTYNPLVFIEPSFRCDYGFNIHTKGFAFINYNCVILDTSPVNIGKGVFIAPGVCIACSGHAIHKDIPEGVIAVGNPCRVLRKITDKDLVKLYPNI